MNQRARQLVFAVMGIGLLSLIWTLGLVPASLPWTESRPHGALQDIVDFHGRSDTNVLFILVDTLRSDHLTAYGYERSTSPRIAELASDGLRFGQHVSQSSWTKCSMASLWTGLYPIRSGVLRAPHVLAEDATLPAEIFRDAGFRTAGIWRNGWIAGNFGFSQGFENYTQPKPSPSNRPVQGQAPHLSLAGSDADLVRSTFSFLRAHGHERWFLYLHMMDVHQYGFSEDEAVFGSTYLDLYDNSILWVDGLIGHIIDELDARGLRDRTLIVLASDHGEAFGEHGSEGHARDVYAEVTTTPLILNFPFRLEPGIVIETRSANVDLWPTVLELTGMTGPTEIDGRSRVPEIVAAFEEQGGPGDGPAFSLLDQTWGQEKRAPQLQLAVHRKPWQLIYNEGRPEQIELYDESRDSRQQYDVAAANPGVVEELKALAEEHLEAEPPWGSEAQSVEIDRMQLDQLRALGYGVQ